MQPMDLAEDEAPAFKNVYTFPKPNLSHVELIRQQNNMYMRWRPTPVPSNINTKGKKGRKLREKYRDPVMSPKILSSMTSNRENMADLFGKLAGMYLLPIAMYQSPLVAMLCREGKEGISSGFTDFFTLSTLLGLMMEYYQVMYVRQLNTPEDEVARIKHIESQYDRFRKGGNDKLQHDLQAIYTAYKASEPCTPQQTQEAIERVLQTLITYTFYVIHLQEMFLYRAIVQPRNRLLKIKLEHILTPNQALNIQILNARDQHTFMNHIDTYFATKTLIVNRVLSNAGQDARRQEWFHVSQFEQRRQMHADELYMGWLDVVTAHEYFICLDIESEMSMEAIRQQEQEEEEGREPMKE